MSPHASVYISVHGNVISMYPPILTYSEKQTNKILHDEFRQQVMFYLELHLLIDL